ncbi:MAG: hypothetical protein ACRD72_25470 [Candidatus Angelobacter sp.]
MYVFPDALKRDDWLIGNYGNRCTLVSSASALNLLGADSPRLVQVIEEHVRFNPKSGPSMFDYLGFGRQSRLDQGIEAAARTGGIEVSSRTQLFFSWRRVRKSLASGSLVVLNCLRAPGGTWNHSTIAVGYDVKPDRLLSVDPNNGVASVKRRWNPFSGTIATVTIITRL